jgi:hypothetical protein
MYRYTADPNTIYPHPKSQENNPSAMFSQMTYPIQQNSQMFPFNQAFNQNTPIIEKQNFKNQNNVIHNNLHENLISEFSVDYTVDIDSKDRDISVYPDPFKYNVMFSPVKETPAPYINRAMKNIKYIRIDNVILPKYYGIVYDSGTSSWIMDTSKDLSQDRYVIMKIKNLDSQYNLSTNSIVETNGIKLIPDTIMTGSNFYYAVPGNAKNIIKTYNMSLLGNLDRLYIEFYSSSGNLLKYNNLDAEQDITDVRNPLNVNLQNNFTIVFGIIENELATEVKFTT